MDRAEPAAGSWRLSQILFFAGGSHGVLQALYYSKLGRFLAGSASKLITCMKWSRELCQDGMGDVKPMRGMSLRRFAFRGRKYSRLRSYSSGVLKSVTSCCIFNLEYLPIVSIQHKLVAAKIDVGSIEFKSSMRSYSFLHALQAKLRQLPLMFILDGSNCQYGAILVLS